MDDERLFPLHLLQASKTQRLAYYDNYTMGHPYLDDAFEMVKPIIRECGDSRVVFVVGPTGAGKTKLVKLIQKWVIGELLSELEIDRGRIPIAIVEAILPQSGLFNAKDHLKRSLRALHELEELIDHKINYGVQGVYQNQEGELVIQSKIIETELGWALEQALKHRRPKIFLVDEAHHTLAVASGRKLTDVPEAIKSLANRTEILHGLVGTYELLTLHDIGEQLSRRSVYIHLPRYNAQYLEDREIWQSVIWNFQGQLPLLERPDLLSIWEYLYERSLGCVGILKNWTRNALADALAEGASTITHQHLKRRELSVGQSRNILKRIKEGEKTYAEIEGQVELLRNELGLGLEPISRKQKTSKLFPSPVESSPSQKRKQSVGQRKPKRDAIGVKQNAG